jgi:putative oxidoreductase
MMNVLQKRLQSFAPLPLRLLLGVAFIYHGYPKVFTTQGHESFVGMLAGIGVPLPELTAYGVGAFELFGGMLLVLGVAVRTVAALGTVEMIVAALTVHLPAGFNFLNVTGTTPDGTMQFGLPGYEVNVLYIAGFVSLLLSGAGRFHLPLGREERTPSAVSDHDRAKPETTHVG